MAYHNGVLGQYLYPRGIYFELLFPAYIVVMFR